MAPFLPRFRYTDDDPRDSHAGKHYSAVAPAGGGSESDDSDDSDWELGADSGSDSTPTDGATAAHHSRGTQSDSDDADAEACANDGISAAARPTIVAGNLQKRKRVGRADGASTPPPSPISPDHISGALLLPRRLQIDDDL